MLWAGRSFRHVLHQAQQAGFNTTILFIYHDSADTCIARVRERVRKGGHDVPEEDIRRRFGRAFINFWTIYRQIADNWHVVYNSGNEFIRISSGEAETVSVENEELFQQFLRLTVECSND